MQLKSPKPWNGDDGLSIHPNSSRLKWKVSLLFSSQLRMDGTAVEMWHYRVLNVDAGVGVVGAYIASGEEGTSPNTEAGRCEQMGSRCLHSLR